MEHMLLLLLPGYVAEYLVVSRTENALHWQRG